MTEPDDLWRCAICAKHWPIQPLARECEARHDQEVTR